MRLAIAATSPLVVQVASLYSLRPDLLAAQITAESAGDPFAFRYEPAFFNRYIRGKPEAKAYRFGPLAACSFGLLQVMLETACEHHFVGEPWDLFDPKIGLVAGARYLRHCLVSTDEDYHRALVRYNGMGPRAEAYAVRVFAIRDAAAQKGTLTV